MALTNLSQITTSGIATGTDLNIRNITGAAATFTGNVTVGGTLTYDDVTNIDSVGLITARSGINVTGGNVKIGTTTEGQTEADDLTIATSADTGMTIRSGTTSKGAVYFSDGTSGDSEFRGVLEYNHSDDHFRIFTAASERFRIKSNGNIGIGTDNPQVQLHLTAADPYIRFQDTAAPTGHSQIMGTHQGALVLSADESDSVADSHLRFDVDGTERLRINNNGVLQLSNGNLFAAQGTTSYIGITGGNSTANGANIWMYGGSHSTNPSAFLVRTGTTERFRITSGGNIGIGLTNPQNSLHINGASPAIRFSDTGANGSAFSIIEDNNGLLKVRNDAGNSGSGSGISFEVDAAERLRITSAGLVGIGSESPRYSLDVYGGNLLVSGSAAGNLILEDRGVGDSSRPFTVINTDGGYFNIYRSNRNASGTTTSSALALRIDSNGKVRIGSSGGDVGILNVHAETDGNLHVRPIADVTGTTPGGSGVVFDVLNDASNTVKDIAFRGATTIFRNASTETLRIDSSGRLLIGRTSTTHGHSLQVQADSGANAIAIQGRSADDQSEITFYENDNSTITAQIQQLVNRSIFRHRVGYIRFDTGGTSEKMRLDANGYLGINNAAPHNQYYNNLVIGDGSASGDKGITIRTQSSNEGVIAFSDADSGAARYAGKIAYNHGSNAMMFFTTNGDERLRIDSSGNVRVQEGSLTVKKGNSLFQFSEYNNGATIWLDGADGDLTGGDYFNISANNSQQLSFGYAGTEHVKLTSGGLMHFGGYPTNPSIAVGSPIKLRAGQGAWAMSIGMRSSQNDYAYIGFTDMNGTEQIGDIFMQRTGANTGHMVFSTNNGSGGSENRLKIAGSGRLCYSPDASFAAESTNISMTIVSSGGDVGGYPGINIRSTDSGGGTNSMNGMSIVSTDANWSLYTNAGSVHGLGILAGNSASSNNAAFLARSDKKITMGPETSARASTTNYCNQAVHIAGGSLGIGALSNYSSESGTGGRYVLGWYHANAYTNRSGNAYLHLTTSLWGGGSPAGNSEFIMGGFKIKSYRYSPAGTSEEIIMFHNWNGGLPGYTREHNGTWDPGNAVYIRSNGYVTIRLTSQNYVGYIIDLMQYNWYPARDIRVTNANFSNSSSL